MSVVINGTGSISGLSNVGGIASAQSGSVIQTVQNTYSTEFQTTSQSFIDTGITATITPQFSNSKILVIASVEWQWQRLTNTFSTATLGISRGVTNIVTNGRIAGGRAGLSASSDFVYDGMACLQVLDSPATTSSTTYKIQVLVTDNTSSTSITVNSASAGPSTITLMEIAA
jgi:hypothetical protein